MKALWVSIAVVVAISVFCYIACVGINIKTQQTIVSVFSDQTKVATKFQKALHDAKNIPAQQRAIKEFARDLQSIDASSCPKDFRLAWFDYVSAVRDMSETNLGGKALKDLIELGMSAYTKDGKLAEEALRDANSVNRPENCLHHCERIAVGYGVRFIPRSERSE